MVYCCFGHDKHTIYIKTLCTNDKETLLLLYHHLSEWEKIVFTQKQFETLYVGFPDLCCHYTLKIISVGYWVFFLVCFNFKY